MVLGQCSYRRDTPLRPNFSSAEFHSSMLLCGGRIELAVGSLPIPSLSGLKGCKPLGWAAKSQHWQWDPCILRLCPYHPHKPNQNSDKGGGSNSPPKFGHHLWMSQKGFKIFRTSLMDVLYRDSKFEMKLYNVSCFSRN